MEWELALVVKGSHVLMAWSPLFLKSWVGTLGLSPFVPFAGFLPLVPFVGYLPLVPFFGVIFVMIVFVDEYWHIKNR